MSTSMTSSSSVVKIKRYPFLHLLVVILFIYLPKSSGFSFSTTVPRKRQHQQRRQTFPSWGIATTASTSTIDAATQRQTRSSTTSTSASALYFSSQSKQYTQSNNDSGIDSDSDSNSNSNSGNNIDNDHMNGSSAVEAAAAAIATQEEQKDQHQESNNNDNASAVLTPYQIIDPYLFPNTHDTNTDTAPKKTLMRAMDLLEKAITAIEHAPMDELIINVRPTKSKTKQKITKQHKQDQMAAVVSKRTIIRIEQEISHLIDPLLWLHAQYYQLQSQQRQQSQSQQTSSSPKLIYFSNNNNNINNNNNSNNSRPSTTSVEAAAVGSCIEHTVLDHHDLANLPDNSRIYGGQRFDTRIMPDSEWKAFGQQGIWMLPQIEIIRRKKKRRRRHDDIDSEGDDKAQGEDEDENEEITTTVLAVHILRDPDDEKKWLIEPALSLLRQLTHRVSPSNVPPTTLPPVISRDSTDQEIYERGVTEALRLFQEGYDDDNNSNNNNNDDNGNSHQKLQKVVLARRSKLLFDKSAELTALDILRKWKFVSEGGHLFYLNPGNGQEFFGCTPEQLFQIHDDDGNRRVVTEALAGTRPRGSTQEDDAELGRQLISSEKDRAENDITGNFIREQLSEAIRNGLARDDPSLNTTDDRYFVRRLLHLQHICQRFQCPLEDGVEASEVAKFLLQKMHPTPAVNGYPSKEAMQFIRQREAIAFDRGYYAGPFGYVSRNDAEIVVAIRSGLVSTERTLDESGMPTNVRTKSLSVFAGAGIVPGSTVQGEWSETSYKLNVISSLFPQSPITMSSAPTPNVAWASVFIEELIRCGVTQFYVCPGSRSTPLVAALSKALRSNVGIVHAQSIHDERAAAFRAVGYARGSGRPAAIITSSGTATANLYPAIMEAGMDGVPLLILTADRPYESRDTGANQAVDQVKTYSSTYIRWFRDIPPPTDDVPVSLALSDANHGVMMALEKRGPVHLNIQFRENLAPDDGQIRNDNRVDSITKFNGFRFTDVPNFYRWSKGGGRWSKQFSEVNNYFQTNRGAAIFELANLILRSKRGIIVVGNIRPSSDVEVEIDAIADFAETIGFPIFAGVQSGSLRSRSSAVIPYAEHLLKNPLVGPNVKPDLVIQIGHPLISTEIPKMIRETSRLSETDPNCDLMSHIFLHPHHPQERADPEFTVTHRVNAEVAPFITTLQQLLQSICHTETECGSELSALVGLGRRIANEIPHIIRTTSQNVIDSMAEEATNEVWLTEPQITQALSEALSKSDGPTSLFLSNSMPVRDAEFFLYPSKKSSFKSVGVNRGASGIDGIIATASGFSDATDGHTSLIIGDLAALHDINSLHPLSSTRPMLSSSATKRSPQLTTIVVNNDGGGIFSFLPIAKHGNDVNFEEFFGTPTNTFSFEDGAKAFGIPFKQTVTTDELTRAHRSALVARNAILIEARVVPRKINVLVHQEITKCINVLVSGLLEHATTKANTNELPAKSFVKHNAEGVKGSKSTTKKNMVLLHGWMGDKSEWDDVGVQLADSLSGEWNIVAIDLPGHMGTMSSELDAAATALRLNEKQKGASDLGGPSIDRTANRVLKSLASTYGLSSIDAVVGYSLGGRVALAMARLSAMHSMSMDDKLVTEDTRIILLGSDPGLLPGSDGRFSSEVLRQSSMVNRERLLKDTALAETLRKLKHHANLFNSNHHSKALWSDFLSKWYGAGIWGDLRTRNPQVYKDMVARRALSLDKRGNLLADVLEGCSPARSTNFDWQSVNPGKVLMLTGELDEKYCKIGTSWKRMSPELKHIAISGTGHALLIEAPNQVARAISAFVLDVGIEQEATQRTITDESAHTRPDSVTYDKLDEDNAVVSVNFPKFSEIPSGAAKPFSLEYESFALPMTSGDRKQQGVLGIGWGLKAKASEDTRVKQRVGFILQLQSEDGSIVGIGEVSPLNGLHPESLEEVDKQLDLVSNLISSPDSQIGTVNGESILKMQGGLRQYLQSLARELDLVDFLPSVKAGLEMCLLSFAAQTVRKPLLQSLAFCSNPNGDAPVSVLPLNGLITRSSQVSRESENEVSYSSTKVKVGYQSVQEDAMAMSNALQRSPERGMLRADPNRGWTESEATEFATALKGIDINLVERIEFVEEPIEKVDNWSLEKQASVLERWYEHTGIKYALDESIAEFLDDFEGDFGELRAELSSILSNLNGCAALILKPSLLGLETSFNLARLAHEELRIGAVFSSSFDSGVGLAYASFLASVADSLATSSQDLFPHGLGTFSMLDGDVLSPQFASYVNEQGQLNTASLSRAFFGLGLDEIKPGSSVPPPREPEESDIGGEYKASAATSSSGREISVVVSLPLPFSDDVACSRFTDLPQASRWSPWLSSVAYVDAGRESEWTLNVRGVKFSWRAMSTIIQNPYRGIEWESISGLKNVGVVEFIPTDENSCLMKVRMTIMAPRILVALFPGASVFLEDYFQNKLLKWSLEMFRDVVKADLALERGDVELGDALFGAVEGRANAIEATLSNPLSETGNTKKDP